MSLERILKRRVKGCFPWRHQGFGYNYHSKSDFYRHRQFLRLILSLIFSNVHLICSFCYLFVALLYYIAHVILRILIFRVLKYCKAPWTINGRWRHMNIIIYLGRPQFNFIASVCLNRFRRRKDVEICRETTEL